MKNKKKRSSNKKAEGAHVVFHRLLNAGNCHSVQAVLLCKRTQDAPIHPGYWALFGGKVENNELPRQAVRREVAEELEIIGVKTKNLKIKELSDVWVRREKDKCLIKYFSSPLDIGMDKLRLKGNWKAKVEGEGLGWFTAEEIHHLVMRPEDRIAATIFFQKNGI